MTSNSRRDFLKNIIPTINFYEIASEIDDVKDTFILGHLTIFPVNSKTKIKLKEKELTVESLPEGICVYDELRKENLKLSLSDNGLLQIHLHERWPASTVLSIITGEMYNI